MQDKTVDSGARQDSSARQDSGERSDSVARQWRKRAAHLEHTGWSRMGERGKGEIGGV